MTCPPVEAAVDAEVVQLVIELYPERSRSQVEGDFGVEEVDVLAAQRELTLEGRFLDAEHEGGQPAMIVAGVVSEHGQLTSGHDEVEQVLGHGVGSLEVETKPGEAGGSATPAMQSASV